MPGGATNASGSDRQHAPEGRHGSPRPLRRLLAEARPHRAQLLLVLLVDLMAAPVLLLSPVPLKVAVDSVIGGKPVPALLGAVLPSAVTSSDTWLLLALAVLQVAVIVLAQLQALGSYVLHSRTGEELTLRIRTRVFSHAQRLSLLRHDAKGTGDSLYRVQYDATALQKLTLEGFLPGLAAAITVVSAIFVITQIDWQLAIVALVLSPLLIVLTSAYRSRMRQRYRQAKQLDSDAMAVVQEVLGALRVVKAFVQEDTESDRFSQRSREGVRARVGLARAEGLFGLSIGLVTALGTAAVLFIGVRNVQAGSLTLGALLLVISYLSQLYGPLRTMSKKTATLQASWASVERVFDFLDEVPEVPERPNALRLPRTAGSVAFEHVSMRYNERPAALHDVSFYVEPGTRIAVRGATGAGKTTLVQLLARFFDPTEGRIRLDGIDLRDFALGNLRSQLALALQEPLLFSTSIAENIRYARPDARWAEVVAAAEQAHADDFIRGLPDGYDTSVGERGMQLSGGERQRISLARAFLRGGSVLVLDEPTSSVDARTDSLIMDAVQRLTADRTTFVIAHRASTLEWCDRWIELDHGRMVDSDAGAATPSVPHPREGNALEIDLRERHSQAVSDP
ncbi:MAG: ABC transporter ATP-binding protein [Actinomycetes bacterium]